MVTGTLPISMTMLALFGSKLFDKNIYEFVGVDMLKRIVFIENVLTCLSTIPIYQLIRPEVADCLSYSTPTIRYFNKVVISNVTSI